ncbi:MAG: hypothetical protein K6F94_02955 [Bacteroidaceae bacterium]|nr:hypothetical protein [Bacteroidaceae bacterium]
MKKILTIIAAFFLLAAQPSQAASKLEKRYAYTLKHLKLDKTTEAKFGPVLHKYLEERKAANDIYDDVKDKYKAAEKAGTLTPAQGLALVEAKLESDTKMIAVRKKYLAEFKKVLKGNKIYYAFDYSNDKMSKIDEERGRE